MNRHLVRGLAAAAAVGLLLLTGCGSEDEPDDVGGSSGDTSGLPEDCSAWADAPGTTEPIASHTHVTNAVWSKVEGYIELDADWTNETELVAVDVTIDMKVLVDGEDITDQLPQTEALTQLRPFHLDVMLPQQLASERGEVYIIPETVTLDGIPANPDWADSGDTRMTLEATPVVDRWCVVKEKVNMA